MSASVFGQESQPLTTKRAVKLLLAAIWALAVVALLVFTVNLLKTFVSAPEEPGSTTPEQPPPEPAVRDIKLFFADANASSLVPEKRSVCVGLGVQADALAVAAELIKGPESERLFPTIPQGTRVINAYQVQDTLVLDFSRELQANHSGGSAGELTTVYSIVNTMVENLRGVKKVQLLLEGEELESLAGHMDLTRPLYPDVKWMKVLPRPEPAPSA
jgi:germination protein M